jgi:hypothetical protein
MVQQICHSTCLEKLILSAFRTKTLVELVRRSRGLPPMLLLVAVENLYASIRYYFDHLLVAILKLASYERPHTHKNPHIFRATLLHNHDDDFFSVFIPDYGDWTGWKVSFELGRKEYDNQFVQIDIYSGSSPAIATCKSTTHSRRKCEAAVDEGDQMLHAKISTQL